MYTYINYSMVMANKTTTAVLGRLIGAHVSRSARNTVGRRPAPPSACQPRAWFTAMRPSRSAGWGWPTLCRNVRFTQGGPESVLGEFDGKSDDGNHGEARSSRVAGGKQNGGRRERHWWIPCSNDPEKLYFTMRLPDGGYVCTCPDFSSGGEHCEHVLQADKEWSKSGSSSSGKHERGAENVIVCGIDEAGAGPVIGPLVYGAVVLSRSAESALKREGVRDSKDIKPGKRELLCNRVKTMCLSHHVLRIEAEDIDRRRAAGESMNQIKTSCVVDILREAAVASAAAENPIDVVYVDAYDTVATKHDNEYRAGMLEGFAAAQKEGKQGADTDLKDMLPKIVSEHRADNTYCVVGAASLIAKTLRDKAMRDIEESLHDDRDLGSGYPSDPKTLSFLKSCNGEFPNFVRQSWKTVDRFR